jgi:hypothetical protein
MVYVFFTFLLNDIYGLPVLAKASKYLSQVFYVWLVDLQNICAKYPLETWFSTIDDFRKCLLDMKHGWTENPIWVVKNKKWHKLCNFVSLFLFINTCGLPVLTMVTKYTNQVFYYWLVLNGNVSLSK